MKNIVKSEQSIGLLEYNVIEKVEDTINIYKSVVSFNLCDIIFYDKDNGKLVKDVIDDNLITRKPANKFTPIGIVVIPSSHNVYSDGSCGVMSLKPMNCNTPTTGGTSNQNICWGVQDTDISSLPDLDQVPTGNTSNGIPTGQTNRAYLPSDQLSGLLCAHDTDAYYVTPFISTIPSPYLTNGSRNPGYYQTTPPSSNNNALADFDGRNNTNKILTVRGNKDYSSWRPHVNGDVDYPAASCCDIFYTEGTQQGDWYLPACGELGYILPPFNKINEAITNIRDVYGTSVGVTLDTSYHWSSTESDDKSRTISMGQGLVYPERKEAVYNVRAWLRVLPNMEVVRN